jgi:hypothetical protein
MKLSTLSVFMLGATISGALAAPVEKLVRHVSSVSTTVTTDNFYSQTASTLTPRVRLGPPKLIHPRLQLSLSPRNEATKLYVQAVYLAIRSYTNEPRSSVTPHALHGVDLLERISVLDGIQWSRVSYLSVEWKGS